MSDGADYTGKGAFFVKTVITILLFLMLLIWIYNHPSGDYLVN